VQKHGQAATPYRDRQRCELLTMAASDAPALRPFCLDTRQMDFMERSFVALTVVGSLGVIAIVIWMMIH
jgi:hypothetical protein